MEKDRAETASKGDGEERHIFLDGKAGDEGRNSVTGQNGGEELTEATLKGMNGNPFQKLNTNLKAAGVKLSNKLQNHKDDKECSEANSEDDANDEGQDVEPEHTDTASTSNQSAKVTNPLRKFNANMREVAKDTGEKVSNVKSRIAQATHLHDVPGNDGTKKPTVLSKALDAGVALSKKATKISSSEKLDGKSDITEQRTKEGEDVKPVEEETASQGKSVENIFPVEAFSDVASTFDVPPALAFFLRDENIIICTALVVAMVTNIIYLDSIVKNRLPVSVALVWAICACVLGHERGRILGQRGRLQIQQLSSSVDHSNIDAQPTRGAVVEPTFTSKHTLFQKFATRFSSSKLRLAEDQVEAKHFFRRKGHWTSLDMGKLGRIQADWEKNVHSSLSDQLLRRLMRNPKYRRTCTAPLPSKSVVEPDNSLSEQQDTPSFGSFDLNTCTADSLATQLKEPLLALRGMDVFLVEGDNIAEEGLATHPFLIQGGLRARPMVVVNLMIAWANIVMYFELPDWFEDFDKIVENEDDADEVKALKRFLLGDDEYRNQRLKFIPCIVDGPRIVRMLAPPVKEKTVSSALLPVSWCKHSGNDQQKPVIEVELDLMSNKATRAIVNIARKNLSLITVDLAVMIDKPDGQKEDEVTACLGMWRWQEIDITTCPVLPTRSVEVNDIRRASQIMNISEEEMAAIAKTI